MYVHNKHFVFEIEASLTQLCSYWSKIWPNVKLYHQSKLCEFLSQNLQWGNQNRYSMNGGGGQEKSAKAIKIFAHLYIHGWWNAEWKHFSARWHISPVFIGKGYTSTSGMLQAAFSHSSIFPEAAVFPAWHNDSFEGPLEPLEGQWELKRPDVILRRGFLSPHNVCISGSGYRRLNPGPVVNHLPQFVPLLQLIVSPTASEAPQRSHFRPAGGDNARHQMAIYDSVHRSAQLSASCRKSYNVGPADRPDAGHTCRHLTEPTAPPFPRSLQSPIFCAEKRFPATWLSSEIAWFSLVAGFSWSWSSAGLELSLVCLQD